MVYDDFEALQQGLRSPQEKASGKDLMGFTGNLVTLILGEDA